MTSSQDRLPHLDAAIARFDQALEALGRSPKSGEVGFTVNGIEHQLHGLAQRLQSLRDAVAGQGDRAE